MFCFFNVSKMRLESVPILGQFIKTFFNNSYKFLSLSLQLFQLLFLLRIHNDLLLITHKRLRDRVQFGLIRENSAVHFRMQIPLFERFI